MTNPLRTQAAAGQLDRGPTTNSLLGTPFQDYPLLQSLQFTVEPTGGVRAYHHARSHRIMRELSIVRDSATKQVEERQSDLAYSRPMVLLVTASVLFLSREVNPSPRGSMSAQGQCSICCCSRSLSLAVC